MSLDQKAMGIIQDNRKADGCLMGGQNSGIFGRSDTQRTHCLKLHYEYIQFFNKYLLTSCQTLYYELEFLRQKRKKNLCLSESCFQITLRKGCITLVCVDNRRGRVRVRHRDLSVTIGVVLVRDDDKRYNCGGSFAICSRENWLDMDSI